MNDTFGIERQAWTQAIKQAQKKINVATKNLEQDAAKVEKADGLREQAMALSEMLYELGPKKIPYTKVIEIESPSSQKKIKVSLDTNLSYASNAEKLFKLVKKLSRADEELTERLGKLKLKQTALAELALQVEEAEDRDAISALAPRLSKFGVQAPQEKRQANQKAKQQEAKEYLEVMSSDGFILRCGRNQNENRAVTFQGAMGSDLWMHLKGVPGAHVLIKAKKNKTIPLATLLEAAQLTLYYSKMREGKKADVDYTFRKNVKAIKGTLAEVTYTDNKTIYVEADPDVVKKLLRLSNDA